MSLAGRPSVRRDHVRGWALHDNPNFPAEHGDLVPACHDRSPFLTVECTCGEQMHLHETQFSGMPRDAEVAARCHGCGKTMLLGGSYLRAAFAEVKKRMRSTRA